MLLHIGDSLLSRYKHIGFHRPLEAIQTRAHERTQRQAKASFSRVQGETSYMESITKSIQGKFTRESRDILLRENCERRKLWRKIIAITSAQIHLTVHLPAQFKEEQYQLRLNNAATCIQTTYRGYRRERIRRIYAELHSTFDQSSSAFTLAVRFMHLICRR